LTQGDDSIAVEAAQNVVAVNVFNGQPSKIYNVTLDRGAFRVMYVPPGETTAQDVTASFTVTTTPQPSGMFWASVDWESPSSSQFLNIVAAGDASRYVGGTIWFDIASSSIKFDDPDNSSAPRAARSDGWKVIMNR
jgi:hypothetical protein